MNGSVGVERFQTHFKRFSDFEPCPASLHILLGPIASFLLLIIFRRSLIYRNKVIGKGDSNDVAYPGKVTVLYSSSGSTKFIKLHK